MAIVAILILFAVFLNHSACAAGIYILDGGTGNGSAWDNALDQVPAMTGITRGDTLYIGDGTYNRVTWSKAASGTTYIYVVKATEANHGLGTGWNSAYGDGVAEFSGTPTTWTISSDYWLFDGVTGSGNSGHGFKLTTTGTTVASKLITLAAGVDRVTISHVEGQHAGMDTGYNQDCIYAIGTSTNPITYITVSYCYFHDVCRVHLLAHYLKNSVFEHSYYERRSDDAIHGEAFSMNYCSTTAADTIRYNVFKDIVGTGYLVIKDSVQGGFVIYGNVFYSTNKTTYYATNGVICNTTGDTNSNMLVYNNTFYNIKSVSANAVITGWSGSGTGNLTKNNLIYGCGTAYLVGTQTADYNACETPGTGLTGGNNVTVSGDPFVNRTGADFHIASGSNVIGAGVALGSPYDIDMDGVQRDDPPTIGAYAAQSAEPPTPAAAPTGLTGTARATMIPELHFTDNSDDETVFRIRINNVITDSLAADDTTFTVSNLTPGTYYSVSVTAWKAGSTGESAPTVYNFTTPAYKKRRLLK